MEELMEILQELRPDVDFESEKALITEGILDSFDIVSLVTAVMEHFDIEISPIELIPENFDSVESMFALISRLREE
ncbi:MAG: acyl carrier protein [Firmicutes bacterium]|nr:acyl carrier protein [Bacillota bacterium]